jgi:fatty acid desaturase
MASTRSRLCNRDFENYRRSSKDMRLRSAPIDEHHCLAARRSDRHLRPRRRTAASIGVWLFFVQHQFEDTSWSNDELWSFHEAALHGSSHYHLLGVLRRFTANIGVHHIHHLCSRIPCYRLPDALRDHPQFAAVGRITLLQSLRCVRMALWDEKGQRLISFEEAA